VLHYVFNIFQVIVESIFFSHLFDLRVGQAKPTASLAGDRSPILSSRGGGGGLLLVGTVTDKVAWNVADAADIG